MRPWANVAFYVVCFAGVLSGWSQEPRLEDAPGAITGNPSSVKSHTGQEAGTLPNLGMANRAPNVFSAPDTKDRVADRNYLLLNSISGGMAVFDVEMTQRCIANHRCREANPVMPSSQLGQLAVNVGLLAYEAWWSYRLKKQHSRAWWIFPTTGIAVHSVGVGTGFAHQ